MDWCETDEYFAEMMVAGPDPTRLTRLDAVPGKFPITSEHLHSVPELANETLESAVAAGRVYWVDQEPMSVLHNGHHAQDAKYIYSPMVGFAVPRQGGAIRPFAIQCGQDPAGREIYTPRRLHLEAGQELRAGRAQHLPRGIDPPRIHASDQRGCARRHRPESRGGAPGRSVAAATLRGHYVDQQARGRVADPAGPGSRVRDRLGPQEHLPLYFIAEHRKNFSFTGNYLRAKLAHSSTDGLARLPYYPYRDDGLLVWAAIRRWADEFVDGYYGSDAEVREDHELQVWAAEVASPDGGAIRDFGASPGTIATAPTSPRSLPW